MKTKNIVIIVLIGFVLSFTYWLGRESIREKPGATVTNYLKSKMIRDWSAVVTGEVVDISDHALTLSSQQEILTIIISEEAKINSLSLEDGEKKSENIQFKDIKIGDKVDIRLSVTSEGNVTGNFVSVLR